jgi:hypothetical protein
MGVVDTTEVEIISSDQIDGRGWGGGGGGRFAALS